MSRLTTARDRFTIFISLCILSAYRYNGRTAAAVTLEFESSLGEWDCDKPVENYISRLYLTLYSRAKQLQELLDAIYFR